MSRPISPKLVLSPDFWISNIPRYFSFAPSNPRLHDAVPRLPKGLHAIPLLTGQRHVDCVSNAFRGGKLYLKEKERHISNFKAADLYWGHNFSYYQQFIPLNTCTNISIPHQISVIFVDDAFYLPWHLCHIQMWTDYTWRYGSLKWPLVFVFKHNMTT